MVYRGFRVESVVVPAPEELEPAWSNELTPVTVPKRVEFMVSETVGGFHWEQLGSQPAADGALQMVDHLVAVREALADVSDAEAKCGQTW